MRTEQEILSAAPYGHNLTIVRDDITNWGLLDVTRELVVALSFSVVWSVKKAWIHKVKSSILQRRRGNNSCLNFYFHINISQSIHLKYLLMSYEK